MTELENQEILHQIYLEKYKTGEANKIVKLLDDANKQIEKELLKTNEVYTKRRYGEIKQVLTNIAKELRENVNNSTDIEGIIDYELRKQKKLFNIGTEDLNIDFLFPSVEQVKTSALFAPIVDTMTFQSYMDSIQAGFYNNWDSAVRTGYLTNETTQKIVRNVMKGIHTPSMIDKGTMATLRNRVYSNTRTVLQAFADETRMKVYKANAKYIQKLKFMATLDRRTCLVCAKMDGKLYDIDKAPKTPVHYCCRCIKVPVIKGVKPSPVRPMEGGVTEGSVLYPEWLAQQPESIQREILGKSRFEMYKKGESITSFSSGTDILTLDQLNGKL